MRSVSATATRSTSTKARFEKIAEQTGGRAYLPQQRTRPPGCFCADSTRSARAVPGRLLALQQGARRVIPQDRDPGHQPRLQDQNLKLNYRPGYFAKSGIPSQSNAAQSKTGAGDRQAHETICSWRCSGRLTQPRRKRRPESWTRPPVNPRKQTG